MINVMPAVTPFHRMIKRYPAIKRAYLAHIALISCRKKHAPVLLSGTNRMHWRLSEVIRILECRKKNKQKRKAIANALDGCDIFVRNGANYAIENRWFLLEEKTKDILDIGAQLMTSFEGVSHCVIKDFDL